MRLILHATHFDLVSKEKNAAITNVARSVLYVKNPLLHDAELLSKIKGWNVPTYLPSFLLLAQPATGKQQYGYTHIPLGLLPAVRKALLTQPQKVAVIDVSPENNRVSDSSLLQKTYTPDPKLRSYQSEVIEQVKCYKRGQIISMTGSGKTIIMSGLIQHFELPTVVLCHRRMLISQWSRAIEFLTGKKPFTLVEGKVTKGNCQILIASMQSIGGYAAQSEKRLLAKKIHDPLTGLRVACMPAAGECVLKQNRLADLKKAGFDLVAIERLLVVVDESHVAPAFGYYNIINSLKPTLIYGCTATPDRKDGRTSYSHAIFTDRLIEADKEEVRRHLVPLQYITVSVTDLFSTENLELLTNPESHLDAEFVKLLAADFRRMAILVTAIKQLAYHDYTQVVVCGNNLWLVEALSESLEDSGISFNIITGSTKDADRTRIIDEISSKQTKVLLATTTIDVGVDITTLDAIVFPIPFSGSTTAIQRAGRIVRKAPGKRKGVIVDFKDELVPRAVVAYYRRRRHILKTFGAVLDNIIPDAISDKSGKDPKWTYVLGL